MFLSSEPGEGHTRSEHTIEAVKKFDTTEKDMPPYRIIEIGQQLGFREFACYPFAWLNRVYTPENPLLIANPNQQRNWFIRLLNSARRRILNMTKDDFRTLLIYSRHLQYLKHRLRGWAASRGW